MCLAVDRGGAGVEGEVRVPFVASNGDGAGGRPGAPRVLVIEPDQRLGRLLLTALRSRGWLVHCVTDVAWVEDEVNADDYALVLLDVAPGVEGETALHTALSARPGQRVMVISDGQDKEWVVQCFNAGVIDYLAKPFVVAELVARVNARLRMPALHSRKAERVARRGGVTLDFCWHTGDVGRGPVRLTNREFLLLDYLTTNAGRVHSREELLTSAWGLAFDPASNLVEVYVRRLRLKLGDDVIETVHRKGYTVGANARPMGAAAGGGRPPSLHRQPNDKCACLVIERAPLQLNVGAGDR
jgi:two-component system OmpR family response regulator